MGFLDQLKDAGSKAADMAKDAGEMGKLKLAQVSAEDELKKIFTEIGKTFVTEHLDTAKELFGEDVAKIDELTKKIEDLKAQIEAVKSK